MSLRTPVVSVIVTVASLLGLALAFTGVTSCKDRQCPASTSSPALVATDTVQGTPNTAWEISGPSTCSAPPEAKGGTPSAECASNADCCGLELCTPVNANLLGCSAACFTDVDCAASEACVCPALSLKAKIVTHANQCVPVQCRSADDCGGLACRFDVSGFHCATADDECASTTSCAVGQVCAFDDVSAHWKCAAP